MAIVRISPTAWMKIQALVVGYDKEVAWYATVEKIGIGEYRMKDILVYPQIASGAFATHVVAVIIIYVFTDKSITTMEVIHYIHFVVKINFLTLFINFKICV